jgi:hypothetical protein
MQNPHHQYAVLLRYKEDHMARLLRTLQSRTHCIALPAGVGMVRYPLAAMLKTVQISPRLRLAPLPYRICRNIRQVAFSQSRVPDHSFQRPARGVRPAFRRALANTSPVAIPLIRPSLIATRSAASFPAWTCSSRSSERNPARTTSLAFSYRPLPTLDATKSSSSVVRFTFLVGIVKPPKINLARLAIFDNQNPPPCLPSLASHPVPAVH